MASERTFPIVLAASRLSEIVAWAIASVSPPQHDRLAKAALLKLQQQKSEEQAMQLAPLIFIDYSMVLCEGAIKLSL